MEVHESDWESYNNLATTLYTIKDSKSGFLVTLTNLGAHTLRVVVPDRNGIPNDVTLTQESPEKLFSFGAFLGSICGRVANRIGGSKFTLEGKEYNLFVNFGPNSLHGGKIGFDKKIWNLAYKLVTPQEVILKFEYVSPDGEEGYPGTLTTTATYFIRPNKIAWEFEATTDKTTIVNLTNHNYWNLDGVGGPIDEQEIKVKGSKYTITDQDGLFTGDVQPVPPSLNSISFKKFSEIFTTFGEVDHNIFLDEATNWSKNQKQLYLCAEAYSPKTGRLMTVRTSEPCVQLYTGNFLGDNPAQLKTTNGNIPVGPHYAFCLETQCPPNSINIPNYKDWVILQPGETYYHRTEHDFSCK